VRTGLGLTPAVAAALPAALVVAERALADVRAAVEAPCTK